LEGKWKRVGKTWGSWNSQVTCPLTLLNLEGDEEVVVVEMGMSQPGEMKRLVEVVDPDVAVLTKVAWVHGEAFSDVEEIGREKAEIFKGKRVRARICDAAAKKWVGNAITFSLTEPADVVWEGWKLPWDAEPVRHNFLAAVAAARAMGVSDAQILAQVGKLQLPKMRMERVERDGRVFINDAYNASPESMKAALKAMPKGKKRVAILGTMVELGPESEKLHREVGAFAKGCVEKCLVLGARAIAEGFGEGAEVFETMEELGRRVREVMEVGDVALVKASRKVGLERVIDVVTNH
jgi:UDP-N-acetylmuramoyl-tripeptide--D-alanyl-D-alanine ligase